jgi:hypothetical protein
MLKRRPNDREPRDRAWVWARRVAQLLAAGYLLVVVVPGWLISGALIIAITAVLIDVHPTPWAGVATFVVLDVGWLVASWFVGRAVLASLRRRRASRTSR